MAISAKNELLSIGRWLHSSSASSYLYIMLNAWQITSAFCVPDDPARLHIITDAIVSALSDEVR
jgi:hypothetical protein